MNLLPGTEKFLTWLFSHSLQAGLLVILVLLVQWIFRGQLTSRWRFALWWVVLARLLLPVGPQSAVSLFNYFHPSVSVAAHYQAHPPIPQPQPAIQSREINALAAPINSVAQNSLPETATVSPAQPVPSHLATATQPSASPAKLAPAPIHARNYRALILPAAVTIWLIGMATLVLYVLTQILRFQWRLSRSTVNAEPAVENLLADCQREFGVSRRIQLLETNAVKSPALFGLFKLRLLLPKGFTEKFTQNELRYVFLHELAHVKRGDLWLNWLITALQIAHWFNPLIWFGFARLRSDRELACDELALLHAGEKTGTCYGETVVKLLEGLSHPAAIPGLIGILEDKKQMRRRILMIANFKRPGRWSALAVLLLAIIAAATLTDAQTQDSPDPAAHAAPAAPKSLTGATVPSSSLTIDLPEEDAGTGPRPDLHGSVRAKGGGPLAATVFISTAGPKTGTSTFCPSCYADCIKNAKADAQGEYEIKSLNPQLVFRILAVAKGYKPKFVSKVDPATGPVAIELEPINAADATPDRSLHGRVLDRKGNPIEGATVEMNGIRTKDGGGRWGNIEGIDPLAVTDANGEFLITAQKPFDMMDVKVEARLSAPQSFSELSSGAAGHDLKMTEGSSLTGRVMRDGKPLPGVTIGVSAVERSAGTYLGHFEVGAGANGVFAFMNLPPNADFYIYTTMNSMKEFGAVPIQKFHSGADGATTQIGDLIASPAYRLQGRVVLSDGQPIPPKTRLVVSREEAWDSQQLTLDDKGGFDTTGIPSETISLSIRIKGYRVSVQNKSLDRLNFRLAGRVDHDITGFVYLLEKGPEVRPDLSGGLTEADMPQNRPLRGAEGGADHSRDWTISGRVIDSETRQPLASFHVTPGQTDQFNRIRLESLQSVDGTKGSYLAYVNKRVAQPLLKIEADGYLPGSITLIPQDSNNSDIALTKGTGPSGTVLDSDGKPAAGASLVLLCEGTDQVGLNSHGELTAYWNNKLMTNTDADGHFKFQPELGMKIVAAATSNGFAMVNVEELSAHPEIRLQSFGKITGTLQRTSALGTNEILDLAFTDKDARNLPRINLNNHTRTDSQGHFTFEGVPPGPLQLSYRVPMGNQSWQNEPLQLVDLRPAQNLELQVNAPDRVTEQANQFQPPPPPKRIPGSEIKGFVLLPSGKPAADVDVAVQVEGIYLALNKGSLSGNSLRENGLMVSSSADGSFTLPLYEGAQSVIALNEEGFAQMSLDAFKASPQIILQQWGRVEGTFQINHHPGSNEIVTLQSEMRPLQTSRKTGTNETVISNSDATRKPHLIYNYGAFQTKTDEKGHFAISFVPPGENTVARSVPTGNRSFTTRTLGPVNVKAGETTIADFATEGAIVIGKYTFNSTNSIDLQNCQASLSTPSLRLFAQLQATKTPEERKALLDTDEFREASKNHQQFPAIVRPDGTFRVEEVPPGKYEFTIQPSMRTFNRVSPMPTNIVTFVSTQTIVVPSPSESGDNTPFDAGTLEMQPISIPNFAPAPMPHKP
jgi:beta-lactamase regulating signal transducer with metallopeptidase domain